MEQLFIPMGKELPNMTEKHMKSEREEWREIGRGEGIAEGEDKAFQLIQRLIDAGKEDELQHAFSDREYREQLYREYEH